VGECFFWYRLTRVVPDQRPLNSRCYYYELFCNCLKVCGWKSYVLHRFVLLWCIEDTQLFIAVCICLSVCASDAKQRISNMFKVLMFSWTTGMHLLYTHYILIGACTRMVMIRMNVIVIYTCRETTQNCYKLVENPLAVKLFTCARIYSCTRR